MTGNYLSILARTISENWEKTALTDFYLNDEGTAQDTTHGNNYTYGEMYQQMMHLGDIFRKLGLKKGDHIAICGANSANWAVAYLAIAAYQGIVVTVLHSQNIEDIAHQIDFSDSVALFADNDIWEELQNYDLPQIRYVISLENFGISDDLENLENLDDLGISKTSKIAQQSNASKVSKISIPHGKPDDLAMICFTSGSSGVSKGVMLSNRNISNNAKETLTLYPTDDNINYISFLPFSHMSGFMGDLLPQLITNRHIFIFKNLFTIELFFRTITICKPYMIISVPQVYLSAYKQFQELFFNTIKPYCNLLCIGGSVLEHNFEDYLSSIGIPIGLVYGLTETAAEISLSPYKQHHKYSCGKVVEGMKAKISSNGEILVSGENVMLGYYKNPEATAQKIDKDGWLHTGDAGYMDEDGYLYVTGRIGQDMIVLPNGENIHPEDIESKLNAQPEVKESIVVARKGKLVALVRLEELDDLDSLDNLEKSKTSKASKASILNRINPQLPLFSQLDHIEFLTEPLQRTAKQTIKRYLYK